MRAIVQSGATASQREIGVANVGPRVELGHRPGEADAALRIKPLLFEHLSARLDQHGFRGDDAQRHAVIDGDIALNAAGLHAWLSRRTA